MHARAELTIYVLAKCEQCSLIRCDVCARARARSENEPGAHAPAPHQHARTPVRREICTLNIHTYARKFNQTDKRAERARTRTPYRFYVIPVRTVQRAHVPPHMLFGALSETWNQG